ncbi:hypothetical protein MVEG_01534 [Podila verticillata NRRL 6337]|nr:hypothetical protein MVEG_01534 [Podila verticillata NRRL 6337]
MKATAIESEHLHATHPPPPPISPTTALAPDRSIDQANVPSVTKADQMHMDTTALGSCLPSPSQSTSSFTSSKSLTAAKEDDVVTPNDIESLQIPLPPSHGPPTPTSTRDLEPGRPSFTQPHLTLQVSEVLLVSSPKMNPS